MTAAGVERAKHYVDGDVINPLLPVPLFKQHVVPELTKIFHVRDVHIRVVLLRHFAHYCRLFDTQILRSYIVPQVRACVRMCCIIFIRIFWSNSNHSTSSFYEHVGNCLWLHSDEEKSLFPGATQPVNFVLWL